MVRMGGRAPAERERSRRPIFHGLYFDGLRLVLLSVHLAIIAYVSFGWLVPSRPWLLGYLLALPLIALQWLVNGGSSIVNNFENLARKGAWNDDENEFEGAFFQTFFRAIGVPATHAQITTVCCAMMLIFWVAAICRMMLIVVPQGS